MISFKTFAVLGALTSVISTTLASPVASPEPANKVSTNKKTSVSSSYWLANIARQGSVPFVSDSSYTIYRNVLDFGADPTGSTDSTIAINAAIAAGSRCGLGCDSTTVTPAIVYFPPGTYLVSAPLVQYYYTQMIGDAVNPPTLKAAANFVGMAVVDSDPYEANGNNWYTNQNNFFRQVRNFVIDLTGMPQTAGAGIHWQVAQATSLQNIVFNMIPGPASKQIGIFMDNGSGGFMTDLVFNGGNYGAFFGNQQFTSRNMTFNGCQTAIFMNWNWVWTLQGLNINNCGVGIDMSNGPAQTVGSVILMDTTFVNTPLGVKMAYLKNKQNNPATGGTLVIDNVDFRGCSVAVQDASGTAIVQGGRIVQSWAQGNRQIAHRNTRIQQTLQAPKKPGSLLNSQGQFFTRSRPQYESLPASSFVSIKSFGAVGDGIADDTAAVQNAMNAISSNQILYFDHGAYLITSTVNVPANIQITGEMWPLIMGTGNFFSDQNNPQPVFRVGNKGQSGAVEMSDIIFEVKGAAPGAIMMEWNLASAQGASGLWDVHFRIGGTAGTGLQSNTCSKNPSVTHSTANPNCYGAFLLFHATSTSTNVYLENTWAWVADHELDLPDHNQIDIYNGRGMLIESNTAWFWGTSSEHSVLYNYQLLNAQNIFMGHIQSETPYWQSNPSALVPYNIQQTTFADPNFSICSSQTAAAPCDKSWGLRVVSSNNVLIYGTGLYSFFENYDQDCVANNNCQQNMISVQDGSKNVHLYGVSTKASTNMVTLNGKAAGRDVANRNNFCGTLAHWTY